MISKPTNQQLIEAVCAELTGKVAPNISDAGTKVVLEMALSVLSCAAVRTAKELAWMKEETDAIEAVARRFAEEMPEAERAVGRPRRVRRRAHRQPLPRRRPGRLRAGQRGPLLRHGRRVRQR